LLLFGFVYYIFEKRNFKLAFIIGLATIASFLMILVWNPVPVQRIKNSLKASEISDEELFRKHSTSIESNVVRRMIWVCGFELIRENPWGVGSGDANAALMKKYEEKGMTGAMSKEFNAHNQFMQTSIALGFIGGAFLILLIVVFFFYSMKVKNSMLSVFLIVTSLNFLVESMMETESGIVFIVLFLCFLYVDSEKIPKFKRRFN
jgi:O-antigen ligase